SYCYRTYEFYSLHYLFDELQEDRWLDRANGCCLDCKYSNDVFCMVYCSSSDTGIRKCGKLTADGLAWLPQNHVVAGEIYDKYFQKMGYDDAQAYK
ncbi:MAG: hypothetical protein RSG57_04445, partial [Christensenellaceae bacterium]